MANEITVLEGDGSFRFQLFLLFPIATPKQVGGNNVVPTPAVVDTVSTLPSTADAVLTATEKTALNNGTKAYRIVTFRKDPNLTNAQLLTLAQARYAEELATFTEKYTQTYLHSGQRFNA